MIIFRLNGDWLEWPHGRLRLKDIEDLPNRIRNDIEKLKARHPEGEAYRYMKDAEFYLAKGDLITAFGCITYAWGLMDAK